MTRPDEWSHEAQNAYAIGLVRLRESMQEAERRVRLASACNGRDDCESIYHLSCCLRGRREADA